MKAARGHIESVVFVSLLALLGVRLLISESYLRTPLMFGGVDAFGTTPATTAWLDWLTLAAAGVGLALRPPALDRSWNWTFGLIGLLFIVLASNGVAVDKQVAAAAGGTLVVLALAGVALWSLAARRGARVLIFAVALAGGGSNAAKCVTQWWYEFDDTARYWEEVTKPQLAKAGQDLNDPMIVNYERRLKSQNAFGHVAHPNVAGSLIAASAVLAVGAVLAAGRGAARQPVGIVLAGGFVVLTTAAIHFTGSKGALTAGVVGVALAIGLVLLHPQWWSPARLASLLLAGYAGLIAFIAGVGLARGTLPGASLAFRWEYWTAGVRGWLDAPLLGVGRGGFIVPYLKHRSAAATEEVNDPHNIWVSLLVELGPIGLLVGALLFAAIVRSLSRAMPPRDAGVAASTALPPRAMLIGTAMMTLALQALFNGQPLTDGNVMLLWLFEFAAVWLVLLSVGVAIVGVSIPAGTSRLAGAALAAAICLFGHNIIDFSLLTPAGLALLVLVVVGGLAVDPTVAPAESSKRPATRHPINPAASHPAPFSVSWLVGGSLLAAVHLYFVALPLARVEVVQRHLVRTPHPWTREVANALGRLTTDEWDSDTPAIIATALVRDAELARDKPDVSAAMLEDARVFAERAIERAPLLVGNRRVQARVLDAQVAATNEEGRAVLAPRAARAWEMVIDGYPTNPRDRIDGAAAAIAAAPHDTAAAWIDTARIHLEEARRLDANRTADNATKLRAAELARIADLESKLSR